MQAPENLPELIEKYQSGIATPEEEKLLQDWYHSFNDEQADIESMDLTEETLHARMLARLRETMGRDRRRFRKPLLRRLSAAAALLMVPVAVYFLFIDKPSKKESNPAVASTAQDNQILPGSDRALLILANGESIALDSIQNGMIAQLGRMHVEKSANGLLSYTYAGDAGPADGQIEYHTISTPRGGQYRVTLSDGTKVWLNAASTIRFPVEFGGNERSVEVTGETYFEVAKDPAMPFLVKTGSTEVAVLGTHFNLNAYHDEEDIRTTLIEGRVKVRHIGKDGVRFLSPGQQSRISADGDISIEDNADIEEAIAWINGRFQFRSAGLKAILRQIARWYDVDVEYRGNVDLRFSGQLERSEQVRNVLEKLKLTGEVNFKIEGRKIIVTR